MGDDSGGTYLTTNIIKLNLDASSVFDLRNNYKKHDLYIFK